MDDFGKLCHQRYTFKNILVLETQLESSNIARHIFRKSLTNYHFSEVQVMHLLPNESDSTSYILLAGILETLMH